MDNALQEANLMFFQEGSANQVHTGRNPIIRLQNGIDKKTTAIGQKQKNVALDSAIAPNLLVDAPNQPHGKDAQKCQTGLGKHAPEGQIVESVIDIQQQKFCSQQDQKIVDHQLPANIHFFHLDSPPPLPENYKTETIGVVWLHHLP